MSRLVDMTGERYGKLKVLKRTYSTYYGTSGRLYTNWKCLCDCGNETVVTRMNLKSGNAKSCGCINKLPEGEANFNVLFRNYKNNAIKRGYKFNLTRSSFRVLTKQICYYCGLEPSMKQSNSERNNGDYIYNGIDRLDNTKGYELGNCVAACKECNLAKGTKTKEEFLNWIKRVYENNESIS